MKLRKDEMMFYVLRIESVRRCGLRVAPLLPHMALFSGRGECREGLQKGEESLHRFVVEWCTIRCMASDYPVPKKAVDEALFERMPEDVKRLQKQSRKELRERARRNYIQSKPQSKRDENRS
jgi:hypothetical protein